MKHPLICKAFRHQFGFEPVIHLIQLAPDIEELVALASTCPEVVPEFHEKLSLFLRQEIKTPVEFRLIAEILEQVFRGNQIFVQLIEITQQHVAPEIKLVKGLLVLLSGNLLIDFVESMHERQSVGN